MDEIRRLFGNTDLSEKQGTDKGYGPNDDDHE